MKAAILLISFLISTPLLAKNIQYVSDELTIPMRSGMTNAHKILKFLNSGEAIEIIEISDDKKYALVSPLEGSSKTGWVDVSLLMKQKSAREQLVVAKARSKTVKEKQKELTAQIDDLQRENKKLLSLQSQLENKRDRLQNTLATLRESASEPIRIADENQQLKTDLSSEQVKNTSLTQQNIILGDQNIKQWFLIGGAVSIGSLILGLLLTRINWKKKDRWA